MLWIDNFFAYIDVSRGGQNIGVQVYAIGVKAARYGDLKEMFSR